MVYLFNVNTSYKVITREAWSSQVSSFRNLRWTGIKSEWQITDPTFLELAQYDPGIKDQIEKICGSFYYHKLTFIAAWINNYIHYKVWDEIT